MTDAPEPPPPEQAPQATPAPPGARPPWLVPALIAAAVIIVLGIGYVVWSNNQAGGSDEAVVVEPYTSDTELISARERVRGHEAPDAASPVAVEFGQGVTLNITGRVARGIGNEWFAVNWNERVVYVRTGDVTTGSGAPPPMIVRERPPPELIEEEEKKPDEDGVEESPFEEPPRSTGALSMGDVNWQRAPNARDFARYFPDRAIDAGVSGNVTLDCIIGGGGRLACSVAGESPDGYGFGRAAINISRQLRVDTRLSDGSSAAGRNLILPLSFRAG